MIDDMLLISSGSFIYILCIATALKAANSLPGLELIP